MLNGSIQSAIILIHLNPSLTSMIYLLAVSPLNLGLQDGVIIAIPIYHDIPITPRWFTGRLPEAIPINPLNHCFPMNDFPIYILIVNHPTTVTPLKLYEQLHDLFMFYHCLLYPYF